jgi:recombinational DNA repair protein (RecF pathway)
MAHSLRSLQSVGLGLYVRMCVGPTQPITHFSVYNVEETLCAHCSNLAKITARRLRQ